MLERSEGVGVGSVVSRRWGWELVVGRASGLDQLSERIACMCVSLCERQLKDQRMKGTAAGHVRVGLHPHQSQEGTGWCSLGVLCVLSVLPVQVYSDILYVCVPLGNTCSASAQAEMDLGKWLFLGYLIWQPLKDIHCVKPSEQSHCEVIFFSVTFKGTDRNLGFRTPVSILKKKKIK